MLFCRPLETICRAKDVFKVVCTFIATIAYLEKKIVDVCIDGGLTMFGFRSEFNAKIKDKTPDTDGCHYVIHGEPLSSSTLPIAIKDKFATIIQAVNYVEASAVNKKLFTKLARTWIQS